MEDTKLMRQQILSKFLCPIMCDSTQPDNICPFGHWPPVESHLKQLSMLAESTVDANCTSTNKLLKPLPAYCCASFLAFKCYKREYSFRCGAHSSNDILTRCSDGFHMDWSELDNLKKFSHKMAEVLLGATEICYLESKFVGLVHHRIGIDALKPLSSSNTAAGHKRPHNVFIKDEDEEVDDDDKRSQVRNLNSTKVLDNVVASVHAKPNNVAKAKQEQNNSKATTSAISRISSRNNDKTGNKLAANRNNRKIALRKKTINVESSANSNQSSESKILHVPNLNNNIITEHNDATAELERLDSNDSFDYAVLNRINDKIRKYLENENK